MKFDLDAVFIEHGCADSALVARIIHAIPADVPVSQIADAREVVISARDQFGAGKRTMIVARRKTPFLMACPAGSAKFACCGYLVLTLASNCPMDCSYCFLQEYLADNPAFQVYANFGPSPSSETAMAIMALGLYIALAMLAALVERLRAV